MPPLGGQQVLRRQVVNVRYVHVILGFYVIRPAGFNELTSLELGNMLSSGVD
jgi:hypothetical protein